MNKLEAYMKTWKIPGEVMKYAGLWHLHTDHGLPAPLGRAIGSSMSELKRLYPESEFDERKFEIWKQLELESAKETTSFAPEPLRCFFVGESVHYGGHEECHIREILDDGMFCLVEMLNSKAYGKRAAGTMHQVVCWMDIFKTSCLGSTRYGAPDPLRMTFSNTSISSINAKLWHAGLDLSPEYQRGNVWTQQEQMDLIEAVFKHDDIGHFCFNRRPWCNSELYEVIDGKQRITALRDFMLDKFAWNDMLWSELHPRDRQFIKNHSITVATIEEADPVRIYKYFLKLNVTGRPVSAAHIKYVEGLLANAETGGNEND